MTELHDCGPNVMLRDMDMILYVSVIWTQDVMNNGSVTVNGRVV